MTSLVRGKLGPLVVLCVAFSVTGACSQSTTDRSGTDADDRLGAAGAPAGRAPNPVRPGGAGGGAPLGAGGNPAPLEGMGGAQSVIMGRVEDAGVNVGAIADTRPDGAASNGERLAADAGRDSAVVSPKLDSAGVPVPPLPGVTLAEQKTPLPVLWLEVGGKSIPHRVVTKTPGRMRVIEDHDGTLRNPRDLLNRSITQDATIGLEYRGNFSFGFPQKSFNLEFQDAMGNGSPATFLGMPAEADWVLYAPYLDKTLLRNALMYEIARDMAPARWSPRGRFVEVFLDGGYQGVYLAVEKVKRDKNRVNVAKLDPAAGADLSGGYIVRLDPGASIEELFKTASGMLYSWGYPQYKEVTSAQKSYLLGYLDKFESTMKSSSIADPVKGYRAYIDVPVWVDYFLTQEISNNIDAYWSSGYLIKNDDARGGKLAFWPAWDFDLSLGNLAERGAERTDVWAVEIVSGERFPNYWKMLWKDKGFSDAVKCRYTQLRKTVLSTVGLNARIDAGVKLLAAAQKRNDAKWNVTGSMIASSPPGRNYGEDISLLRVWIARRLAWMDEKLLATCPN